MRAASISGLEREGFSLIEVMMALLVLAVGLLSMAGATGSLVRQTELADVVTERTAARRSVLERIRAQEVASVAGGSTTTGSFQIQWTVIETDPLYKRIQVVTTGPGLGGGAGAGPSLASDVADTLVLRIVDLRP